MDVKCHMTTLEKGILITVWENIRHFQTIHTIDHFELSQ